MQKEQIRQMTKDAFEDLVQQIEAGKSQTLMQYLRAMANFHRYSLNNAILIHCQRPDATHVAGFRTWQKLGRQVRKGERGIAIMAPVVYRKRKEDEEESEEEIVTTFKAAYVFDISQTDGRPLPEFARATGDPRQYLDRLEQFVSAKKIKLERVELGTVEGLSAGGRILLKQGLRPAEQFSVLCHELAHLCSQFGYVSFI